MELNSKPSGETKIPKPALQEPFLQAQRARSHSEIRGACAICNSPPTWSTLPPGWYQLVVAGGRCDLGAWKGQPAAACYQGWCGCVGGGGRCCCGPRWLSSTLASPRSLTLDWLCSGKVCPRKFPSTFSVGGNPGPTRLHQQDKKGGSPSPPDLLAAPWRAAPQGEHGGQGPRQGARGWDSNRDFPELPVGFLPLCDESGNLCYTQWQHIKGTG